MIGAGTTVIYAVLALAFSYSGIAATGASVLAFLIAAVFSYAGHKYVTFASDGSHTFEVPRFLTVSATSLTIVSVLPAVLTGVFGLSGRGSDIACLHRRPRLQLHRAGTLGVPGSLKLSRIRRPRLLSATASGPAPMRGLLPA